MRVYWEMTQACMLACRHCRAEAMPSPHPLELTPIESISLPLLPFLFAAGAAGTSAFVAQLRPYLLVLSVLLIAFGFYKSWRAKQCNCKPSRISTFLLWFS